MKKIKALAAVLALVMTASVALAGCGEKSPGTDEGKDPETKDPVTLAINVGPEPDTIDPALNSAVDGGTVINHAFEGLMTLDKDGVPIVGQAESYKISDDGLTYTFTLRDGLKWSDGTPLTAEDFVYSWNRAISPDTAADYAYMFEVIEGYEDGKLNVTAKDEKTLEIKIISVTPYFLELCAFPAYAPVQKATVEKDNEGWATEAETYIGNGPYVMKEWVHDAYILMEKNEYYWNYEKLGPDEIKFVLMEDDNARLSAYESGELLSIDSMPNAELDRLSGQKDFYKEGQLGTYYVSFNTENEFLKNPDLRAALTLAIDRVYICEKIGQSGQEPAGAFVSTGLSDADVTKEFREVGGNYYDPTDYEGNLVKAKEYLAKAGYPNGEGLPTFEYLYNENTGHQQIGEALQDMWSKIGVKVELVSQEWGTFLNTRKNGEYDIARNGWLADYNDPITFLDMWITDGGNNDAQWSNKEYDELISKVKKSSDVEERMELMHQAEKIIFDEWMLAPIYYYVDTYMLSEKVEGFYSTPLGFKYFMYTSITE